METKNLRRYFHLFSERMRAVFWVRDYVNNTQIYLSPGYEKIWGRTRESLYNDPDSWMDTIHHEDREKLLELLKPLKLEKNSKSEYEYRFRIITPEGKICWIKDTCIITEDQKHIGFAEDITQEVLHTQKLQEARLRAEAANQAKSDFLAMVSHELRTPLNAILGMTQILKTKALPEGTDEYVDIINSAGNSLLSLVNDILDFARLEAGKLTFSNEMFDLKSLFNQQVQNMEYLAKNKNLTLTLSYPDAVPSLVIGDSHRVRQILLNLLSNAIKFTDQGSIHIEVEVLNKTENKILFQIKIADTGIGISNEHLKVIFEKFNQINCVYQRKHGGIGLGLAITRELAQAMGGDIKVKSEYQKGSEFSVTLQLTAVSSHSGQEDHFYNDDLQDSKQYQFNILLVEDNTINQKIAKIMLEDFGCQVTIINNGYDALIQITQAAYDLIFMDIGLPDMSGFTIARKIREELLITDIPIIAITAHVLERDKEEALKAGMNKILAKPISYQEVEKILRYYRRAY